MQESSERRQNDRSQTEFYAVKGMFEVSSDSNWQPLLINNLSNDGLCIQSDSRIDTGENIAIVINLPCELQIQCLVAWCKKDSETGAYITGLLSLDKTNQLQTLHHELFELANAPLQQAG
jgi:hypothetical protein